MIKLLMVAFSLAQVEAGPYFPSVAELQEQLQLPPGRQLPKDVQNKKTGRIFHTFYLRGFEMGDGSYCAVLKLRPT